jgi:hypothetical protein
MYLQLSQKIEELNGIIQSHFKNYLRNINKKP